MTYTEQLLGQLEFYWTAHLRPRLAGLTDEEYGWLPTPDAWTVRADAQGLLTLDGLQPEPPVPPVTTLAWRLAHLGVEVLGRRAHAFFGPSEAPADAAMWDRRHWPVPFPTGAAEALAVLDEAYRAWHGGVSALDDDAVNRPLGPRGGPYAEQPMAELMLHQNREVMAHGAEICLLRDLYRAQRDAEDSLVAAARTGAVAEVRALLSDGIVVRPGLLAEVAGLQHWEVVRALVESGVPVNDDAPHPTALHFAAATADDSMIDLLLAHGADRSAQDPRHHAPPADWAQFHGRTDLAARLRPPMSWPVNPWR